MWSIYKHNFPNDKCYIGLTKQDPKIRFKNGYGYEKCPLMWKAIQKYGWENIQTEWLATNIDTLEEAAEKEKAFIKEFDSSNPEHGYNLAKGGQGGTTYKYDHNLIMQYWFEGYNTKDISERIGCSFNTIYRVLDENNIPSEERRARQNKENGKTVYKYDYKSITQDWLNGMSVHEIVEKYGCSRGTVRNALNKENVDLELREMRRKEESKKSLKEKYNKV